MADLNDKTKDATEWEVIPFPFMSGNANMARGAGQFEVPLFSHVIDTLWQGCSPAEFPDELEEHGYFPWAGGGWRDPVHCHWLWEEDDSETFVTKGDATFTVVERRPRFDSILNLYVWGKYVVPDGVNYTEVEMYDSGGMPDKTQIDHLATQVALATKVGQRVLVHCQAGLNRSSLVVARALMIGWKLSADKAIDIVRESRSPMCLCNEDFERFLRSYDDD